MLFERRFFRWITVDLALSDFCTKAGSLISINAGCGLLFEYIARIKLLSKWFAATHQTHTQICYSLNIPKLFFSQQNMDKLKPYNGFSEWLNFGCNFPRILLQSLSFYVHHWKLAKNWKWSHINIEFDETYLYIDFLQAIKWHSTRQSHKTWKIKSLLILCPFSNISHIRQVQPIYRNK